MQEPRLIRNVVFDWSGTLVDDLEPVWRATDAVLQAFKGRSMSLEEFRREFQLPFTGFYERFLPDIKLSELETVFHRHFSEHHLEVHALPYAHDFLSFCKSNGLRLFILSTVHSDYFHQQSSLVGMESFFEKTYLGIHDKCKGVAGLINENGLEARNTLFIGDMQHDIDAAHSAGMASCAVLTGYNRREQLMESQPDVVVEHLGELMERLRTGAFQWPLAPSGGQKRIPIATVGALVFNKEGKMLMIRTRKWSDKWGIPGGKIKYGETALTALKREVMEETALEIGDVQFVLVQDCIESDEFYRREHFLLLNYVCRARGNDLVRLNHEAQAWQWLSKEEASGLELNHPTKVLLNKVIGTEYELGPL